MKQPRLQDLLGLTVGYLAAFTLLELSSLAVPFLRFSGIGFVLIVPLVAVFSYRWSQRRSSPLTANGWLAAFALAGVTWFALFALDHLLFDPGTSISEALDAWARIPRSRHPGTVLQTIVPCVPYVAPFALFSTYGLAFLAERPHCPRCDRFPLVEAFRKVELGHVPEPFQSAARIHIREADERARQLLQDIAVNFNTHELGRTFERHEASLRPAGIYELQLLACQACRQRSIRICELNEEGLPWKTSRRQIAVERVDDEAGMTAPTIN